MGKNSRLKHLANNSLKMASHVSDTERAIFWTKWRFAQCFRSNGGTENQKGISWKKRVIFVALVSVFLIFCLRSKMSSKSGKRQVLQENMEKKSFDEKPKQRIQKKINVKDQKDLFWRKSSKGINSALKKKKVQKAKKSKETKM